MITNARRILGFTLLTLTGAGVGCAALDDSDAARVSVTIDRVPENLACVRVKTQGNGEDWRLYDVARGAAKVSYDLSGLPDGAAAVTVEGFDVACRSVGPFSAARWSAPPQTLARGAIGPRDLHFVLSLAVWTRSAAIQVTEGVHVTFSSIAAPGDSDAGSGSATGDSDAGAPGGGGTGADAGAPDGAGTGADAGAPDGGAPGSTTFCWGAVCVTLTGTSTADGGVPVDGGLSGGGSGAACFGSICWVRRLKDGGVPPGATCLGSICAVPAPTTGDDGGIVADGGGAFPRAVCGGGVCAEFVPRRPIDADGGFPDGGVGGPVCQDGICVFVPTGDSDGGASTGHVPVTVCGTQSCVMLRPAPNADGGVPLPPPPGGSSTLGTVCFEQTCVTVSLGSGSSGGDAGTP